MVASEVGLSVNTYCKYLQQTIDLGLASYDNAGNLNFKGYKDVFLSLFGGSGNSIIVDKSGSFQQVKENIRAAVLLANFRQQSFIVLGDSQMEQGKKLSRKESLAKNWIRTKAPHRASSVNNILTSARQAGRATGTSQATGNKTLLTLLKKKLVQYSFQQTRFSVVGTTKMKVAFAESNLPYPGCRFSILKQGVLFHAGRFVELTGLSI